jgi:hypothetical protein
MTKGIALFGLFLASTAIADEIALPDGRVFHHARISKFYAGEFVIEHDGGMAHIPWAQMAPELRQRYSFEPQKAAEQRDAAERDKAARLRKAEAEQIAVIVDRSKKVTPMPSATPQPPNRDLPLGMSSSEVLSRWGPPKRRRTIQIGDSVSEAWIYEDAKLYFENDQLRKIQR